jgi:MOSC domain-containing protein YiiM
MEKEKGRVYSLNIGERKGEPKKPVSEATFLENFGIVGDVHAGLDEKRQVSILSWERIKEKNFCLKRTGENLKPGDFAENITIAGLDLTHLEIGTRIFCGQVILEVSQIGKKCHTYCEIYKRVGSCLMPKEGIFARVLKGGRIRKGDTVEIYEKDTSRNCNDKR